MPIVVDVDIENCRQFDVCKSIRSDVFITEQNCEPDSEFDDHDKINMPTRHILCMNDDGVAVGTSRMRPVTDDMWKLERICVLKEHRGFGYGRDLMQKLIEIGKSVNAKTLKMHAQTHAIEFYKSCGFEVIDDNIFYEENIPHVTMSMVL